MLAACRSRRTSSVHVSDLASGHPRYGAARRWAGELSLQKLNLHNADEIVLYAVRKGVVPMHVERQVS
jgi:hypothetical protein